MSTATWSRALGRLAELVAYACGFVALGVVVRHIAVLLELVTIGPLPILLSGKAQGWLLYRLLDSVGLGGFMTGDAALLSGLVLVGAGAVLAARVRRTRSAYVAGLVLQVTVSLAVLGYSYRFAGLVTLVMGLVWQWACRPTGLARWGVWTAGVALCLAPYDVTCRNLDGPARLETEVHCGTAEAASEYVANQRVCVGGDAGIYNEPSGVWVW